MSMPALPVELILQVVEFVAPSTDQSVILPLHHTTSRTLLSLISTCRATSSIASRLFYRHCVYIDSPTRAQRLAASIQSWTSTSQRPQVTAMFLSPFAGMKTQELSSATREEVDRVLRGDYSPSERPLLSMSGSSKHSSALDDPPTAIAVRDILVSVAATLRHLVIDMPLRSLWPYDDVNQVRPKLRQGFEALVNLEEFVSIRDELFLTTVPVDDESETEPEPDVWAACWPKLRRLSLYNAFIFPEADIWQGLACLDRLETVILPRSDFPGWPAIFDMKQLWIEANNAVLDRRDLPIRPLTFVLVDLPYEQPGFGRLEKRWAQIDPEDRIRLRLANLPFPTSENRLHKHPITAAQAWIRTHALAGTLWDLEAIQNSADVKRPYDV